MIDVLLNIITWTLITAGVFLIMGLVGLCFFLILEKMND
jgi:preprotein translocase subunit Sss1